MRLQMHKHTTSCGGVKDEAKCRYGMPRPVCEKTRLHEPSDKGLDRGCQGDRQAPPCC